MNTTTWLCVLWAAVLTSSWCDTHPMWRDITLLWIHLPLDAAPGQNVYSLTQGFLAWPPRRVWLPSRLLQGTWGPVLYILPSKAILGTKELGAIALRWVKCLQIYQTNFWFQLFVSGSYQKRNSVPAETIWWLAKTVSLYYNPGFPGGTSGKEPACQCRSLKIHWFNPWVRKIPCRRAQQPNLVFLLGESRGERSQAG